MLACWEKCENYVLSLPEASVTVTRGARCPDNGQKAAVLSCSVHPRAITKPPHLC